MLYISNILSYTVWLFVSFQVELPESINKNKELSGWRNLGIRFCNRMGLGQPEKNKLFPWGL